MEKNKHADALSRRPYDYSGTAVTTITMTSQGHTSPCQGQEPYSSSDDLLNPGAQDEGHANKDDGNQCTIEVTFEYANAPPVSGADAEPDLSSNLQELFGETTSPVVPGHSQFPDLTENLPHADLIHMQENCPDFKNREMPDNEKEAKATLWESEQYILADKVLYQSISLELETFQHQNGLSYRLPYQKSYDKMYNAAIMTPLREVDI